MMKYMFFICINILKIYVYIFDDPTRVRVDTGPGKFRKVLKIITRRSTLMISNDTQSQSEHSCSQLY